MQDAASDTNTPLSDGYDDERSPSPELPPVRPNKKQRTLHHPREIAETPQPKRPSGGNVRRGNPRTEKPRLDSRRKEKPSKEKSSSPKENTPDEKPRKKKGKLRL
jgi:hypothetical protein